MGHGDKGSGAMGHDTDAQTADDTGTSTKRFDESSNAVSALAPVHDAYFDVQMSLAKDDLDSTRKAGTVFAGAIAKQDGTGFTEAGRDKWQSLHEPLIENARKIAKAEDIAMARDGFFHLSENMIELHKNFGHSGDESFYLTFCPMAREGGGAFWLQTLDVVWNSFYGAQMLRCGTIKEELPPRSRNKK